MLHHLPLTRLGQLPVSGLEGLCEKRAIACLSRRHLPQRDRVSVCFQWLLVIVPNLQINIFT